MLISKKGELSLVFPSIDQQKEIASNTFNETFHPECLNRAYDVEIKRGLAITLVISFVMAIVLILIVTYSIHLYKNRSHRLFNAMGSLFHHLFMGGMFLFGLGPILFIITPTKENTEICTARIFYYFIFIIFFYLLFTSRIVKIFFYSRASKIRKIDFKAKFFFFYVGIPLIFMISALIVLNNYYPTT